MDSKNEWFNRGSHERIRELTLEIHKKNYGIVIEYYLDFMVFRQKQMGI